MPETITNEITDYMKKIKEKLSILERMKTAAKTTQGYDCVVEEMEELNKEYARLIKKQLQ